MCSYVSLCVNMVHSCIRALSAEYSPLPWYPCTSRVEAMQTLVTTVMIYHMLINYTPLQTEWSPWCLRLTAACLNWSCMTWLPSVWRGSASIMWRWTGQRCVCQLPNKGHLIVPTYIHSVMLRAWMQHGMYIYVTLAPHAQSRCPITVLLIH